MAGQAKIRGVDMAQDGATTGQAWVWDGSTWSPDDVAAGAVSVISPTQITSDQNDYSPTGWETADVVRLDFDSNGRAITSFAAWSTGKSKTLINISENFAYFPSEHGSGTAANRILGETDFMLAAHGAIEIYYDSTTSRIRILSNSFDPSLIPLRIRGLYFNQMPGSTNQSDQPFLGLAQLGGSNGDIPPTTSLPPTWGISTGSSPTGVSTIFLIKNANAFAAFGNAHISAWAWVYIPTLSTSSQRFDCQLSITASPEGTTLAVNNSIGIRYADDVNTGKWQIFSRGNTGTETTVDSGITVAANTLYLLRIFMNKARTEARYSITDGTNVFTDEITANIPSAVVCGARTIINKRVGTSELEFRVANLGGFSIY